MFPVFRVIFNFTTFLRSRKDLITMSGNGSVTLTYQFLLYNRHMDWIDATKELYNRVLKFYFFLLLERRPWMELSNHALLRELEILTFGTRQQKGKENPSCPLQGFPKLPLYFRRAAINAAIGMARSYFGRLKAWEDDRNDEKNCPSQPSGFYAAPVYYKGMYRNFTDSGIELKLYTGEEWHWVTYGMRGKKIPAQGKRLSPVLKRIGKQAYLYVPVALPVQDIRTVKDRLSNHSKLLAVAFPNGDCMAAGAVFNEDRQFAKSHCFYGGGELKACRNRAIRRLNKSLESRKKSKTIETEADFNKKIYNKITAVNQHFTNQISRQIVDYCVQEKISLIVVPNYEKTLDFTKRRYLKTNEFDWLGRSVIQQLKYKAFQQGIVVSTVRPYHITDVCSRCGAKIQKYNEGNRPSYHYYGGKLFQCPNGHHGNSAINAAVNIGLHFFSYHN